MIRPVHDASFTDPFVLRPREGTYITYGSGPPTNQAPPGDRVFEPITSLNQQSRHPRGRVLEHRSENLGDEYWAPDVARVDGAFWMYYSLGHGIAGHHMTTEPNGTDTIAWNEAGISRQMYLSGIDFTGQGPRARLVHQPVPSTTATVLHRSSR